MSPNFTTITKGEVYPQLLEVPILKNLGLLLANLLVAIFLFTIPSHAQSVKQLFSNSGIWGDYTYPVLDANTYPEFDGRLVNIAWSDIEVSPNVWDWTIFDQDIQDHVADGLPVIFMVYTGDNAPQWIYSNGVPKVNETNSLGVVTSYSPYYLDTDYNFYFKRMITQVRKHVETLQPSLRNNIIGVQACFGNTGDQISYKGNVSKQYAITDDQFDSLFKVYSAYYYNEYKDETPAIKVLSNPNYYDPSQQYWLIDNCPGGWTKCGTIAKGFQLNGELDKMDWLYDIMNKPWAGDYIKSRCEIYGSNVFAGWWTKNQYKSMFALMCYCIYWGLDWPNETDDIIQNSKFDSALHFFNKYAGQKVAGAATNAMCALKDVLDASDDTRFPASIYGTVDKSNTLRYLNICAAYALYGAKLEDQLAATGNEYNCLSANGTNDVGWRLLPGNYDRYLHQIDANSTSAGYWNVNSENNNAMYGRFARGFDLSKGKNALYFDVDDAFLRNTVLNGKYAVTIDVTYYDNGNGSWQLFYDAQSGTNKASTNVVCTNTKTWKKKTLVLSDAYFGNRSIRNSDFYIKSTNNSNVIFSVVELSRPQQPLTGFLTTPLSSFDTICLNSTSTPKSFVLNGGYLDGTNVQVGPLNGFLFSTSANGSFNNSLIIKNYGTDINTTVYVKADSSTSGSFNGNIPVAGGGVNTVYVNAQAAVLNTSPNLNASITQISCYNKNDGAINLSLVGGVGPFTYYWSSSVKSFWHETTQDVNSLSAADYTVQVGSSSGCNTSKTFTIINPDQLTAPTGISGPSTVQAQQLNITYSALGANNSFKYIWTVPTGVTIKSGQNTPTIIVNWSNKSGTIAVKAQDNCNTTTQAKKTVNVSSGLNKAITGFSTTGMEVNNTSAFISPNPASDIATLQFYAEDNSTYNVQLSDLSGKILLVKKTISQKGLNTLQIDVRQFSAGAYFITLMNDKGEKQMLKLLKQ